MIKSKQPNVPLKKVIMSDATQIIFCLNTTIFLHFDEEEVGERCQSVEEYSEFNIWPFVTLGTIAPLKCISFLSHTFSKK